MLGNVLVQKGGKQSASAPYEKRNMFWFNTKFDHLGAKVKPGGSV